MKYLGGKFRIAKAIANRINGLRPKFYWEPFTGAGNVIQYIQADSRLGTDIDPHIICYLNYVRDGYQFPAEVSEDEYSRWKALNPSSPLEYAMKAHVGYGCSFSGKWFGGYARGSNGNGKPRNFARESADAAKRQGPRIQGINFQTANYQNIPANQYDVIYCDPPYRQTTGCGTRQAFSSDDFWDWAYRVSGKSHIFVSEFIAPPGWAEVYSHTLNSGLRSKAGKDMTERLFYRGPDSELLRYEA